MQQSNEAGLAELREARARSRALFIFVGVFSVFVNLLMLTGPIFMLQVYDRVLGSRSEATLVALAALVAFLYLMMGLLDFVRGRVLARAATQFQSAMDQRVFAASIEEAATRDKGALAAGPRDLETVQKFIGSPVLASLFDLPFTPIFIAGIFIFHPWLGWLALGGGTVLVLTSLLNQKMTRGPVLSASQAGAVADRMSDRLRNEADVIQSLGMRGAAFSRWSQIRGKALGLQLHSSDVSGRFSAGTKTFRLFLQSAMLGLGAYLVLQNELTAGAMIAGSILLGRALAPIEMAVGQWSLVQAAMKSWQKLAQLLSEIPKPRDLTALPRPRAILDVNQVTVIPPGEQQASLRLCTFRLEPGQAIGVIGPSGAGKSTLARAITGVWRAAGGKIRLDGATLDQYDPDVLGRLIGYLPQQVTLFDGTIAENIARLDPDADDKAVVAAAKKAAAHELILKLPDGYNTRVAAMTNRLSGGQTQRIGLARALYGDPVFLVLDEPNSNLDNDGSEALNLAIRQMKAEDKSVLIMAHRPAAIQECDMLLVLDGGGVRAFGPRDEVLRKMVKNANEIQTARAPGGVA